MTTQTNPTLPEDVEKRLRKAMCLLDMGGDEGARGEPQDISALPEDLLAAFAHELSQAVQKERERIANTIQNLRTPTDDDGNYLLDPMVEADQFVQITEDIVFDRTTAEVQKRENPEGENYDDIPF